MKANIVAIVIYPDQPPVLTDVANTLEAMQEIVGGYIEPIRLSHDGASAVLLVDEEGALKGKPHSNLASVIDPHGRRLVGTSVLVGSRGSAFSDLPLSIVEWMREIAPNLHTPMPPLCDVHGVILPPREEDR